MQESKRFFATTSAMTWRNMSEKSSVNLSNLPLFALVPRKVQRVPGQQVGIIKIYEDSFVVPIQLEFLMVSLTSLEVPHEGCVSGGSLPSSWWGVFHSFPLWMNNGLWIQDHAHASSRNRFSIPTAYITVLQHEQKPATTGSLGDVPELSLKPTNLYHAAR